MPPMESLVVLSTATLTGVAMLGGLAAWAWGGWLKLKTHEIDRATGAGTSVGQRIDLADLKERIRKLEAIAAGVDI